MKNLKIEYVDGQLVTVEVEGISLIHAGLSGLNFSHFLGKEPLIQFKVGGEIPTGLAPIQQQVPVTIKECKLIQETPDACHARTNRNKNRNRNRSH